MCFIVLDSLKHFINHVMEDQLLSADYGHLSFCTMQCNELVLTLQDSDSMFLWNVRMISLYNRCKNSEDHHSNTCQEKQKIYDVLHCWSVMKKTSTQLETKFSEVCSGVWKQGSSNELLKINDKQAIYTNKTFKFIHLINVLYAANEVFNSF